MSEQPEKTEELSLSQVALNKLKGTGVGVEGATMTLLAIVVDQLDRIEKHFDIKK